MPDEKQPCCADKTYQVFGLGRQKTVAVDHVGFRFLRGRNRLDRGRIRQRQDHFSEDAFGIDQLYGGGGLLRGKKARYQFSKKKQEYWKVIQAIFQDPFSSYNIFNRSTPCF